MEPRQVGPSRFPWGGWHSSRAAPLEGVGVGGGMCQLCSLPQLSQCRGPVEITVKFILHIFPSWTRWLLAGLADPTRQEALEAKEIYPPTSMQHRAPPNTCLPGPTSAFCPKSIHAFSWGDFLYCASGSAQLLLFCRFTVTVGFGRWLWLDSTSAQGHPEAPGQS